MASDFKPRILTESYYDTEGYGVSFKVKSVTVEAIKK